MRHASFHSFQYDATLAQEAIGNTVLDVMENEDLQENAWNVGNLLIDNFKT
jgi:4-aminobutyrate aminotransferase-like enzyme